MTNLVLQLGPSDLLSILTANLTDIEILLLSVAGYLFFVMTARKTWLWAQTSATERYLIGIILGLGFEGLLFWMYVTFAFFDHQLFSLTYAFNTTATASIAALVILSIFLRTGGITESVYRGAVSTFARMLVYVNAGFLAFDCFLWFFVAYNYPPETRGYLTPFLAGSFGLGDFSVLYSVAFYISYHNVFHRRLPAYLPLVQPSLSKGAKALLATSKSFGRKPLVYKGGVLIIIALLVAASSVSIDLHACVVTPSVSYGTHTYTGDQSLPYPPTSYFLDVVGEAKSWLPNGTSPCIINSFQPMDTQVRIRVPLASSIGLTNVTIQNPSNVSLTNSMAVSPNIFSTGPVWEDYTVTNPNSIYLHSSPNNTVTSSFNLGFAGKNGGTTLVLGIYYYVEMKAPLVCTETLANMRLPNGSEIATEKFVITNNGNGTLALKVLSLKDVFSFLVGASTGSNSTRVSLVWRNNSQIFTSETYNQIEPIVGIVPPNGTETFIVMAEGKPAF